MQQHQRFNNLNSFLWQFINGNAAPHLWYNTMMLQFIILMPFFWSLAHWTKNSFSHAIIILSSTIILFSIWIMFYDTFIFHGPQQQSWYLLDRSCVSFFIYAILGLLSYLYRPQLIYCLKKSFPIIIIIFIGSYYWTNRELFSFGFPLKLANAPYYKPSMTLYALMVIALIATLAIKRIRQQAKSLPIIHSLATYAYRAYLSNVFWLQIIWYLFGKRIAFSYPILAVISCYLLTWGLSFASAYLFHFIWIKVKLILGLRQVKHTTE